MLEHGLDTDTAVDVAVEHLPDQVDTVLAHDVGDAEVVVHDLVDGVEGVLLVDDGVEQDAEGPDVLLFAAVWGAAEDFGSCVICLDCLRLACLISGFGMTKVESLPIVPTKTSKGPLLMYAALPKSTSFTLPSPSKMTFSSLISRCTTLALM